MAKKFRKISKLVASLILIFVAIPSGIYVGHEKWEQRQLEGPSAPQEQSRVTLQSQGILLDAEPKEFPSQLNIELPFFTQAPHRNWDYPWQEACEEASITLIANLYNNMQLDKDSFNEELLYLVDTQMDWWGAYEHSTVEQTVKMIEDLYELETKVHADPSFEDIQSILNRGNLIIAPLAGKLLGNPNFHNGGPVYHMLVIKGYDAQKMQIVTHDVGTKRGDNYVYDWEVIEEALHDWHDDDILLGEPLLIEVVHPS